MTLIRSCVVPGCKVRSELEPDAYACPDCRKALVRKLGEIETYLSIADIFEQPGRQGGGPHAKGFESQPPLNLDVVAMLDPRTEINGDGQDDRLDEVPNVHADLGGWAQILVEEHPDGLDLPRGLTTQAALLRSRCDWIARQPWVDEMARDIHRVHSALRRACADLPPASVGECIALLDDGDCKGDVYPTRDHDGVRCSRCGRLYYGMDLVRLHVAQGGNAA